MNMFRAVEQPVWRLIASNVFFWPPSPRPLGGLIYRTYYAVFGMNPFPFYLTSFLMYAVNLGLLFALLFRITRNAYLAVPAAALASIHREMTDIWFNFGALYELLAFGFMLASFHFYLSFLDAEGGPRKRYYILALAAFLVGLNGKEMAVVTPAILALYELVYRIPIRKAFSSIPQLTIRLSPFFAAAIAFTIQKMIGKEAYWRDNRAYQYQFDTTFYHNLHDYLGPIFYNRIDVNDSELFWTLAISLGLAILLRNRHMLFGWFYFLIALLPVIALPRVWGLFLYIPLMGMGLYVATLFLIVGGAVGSALLSLFFSQWQMRRHWRWVGVALLLGMLMSLHYSEFISTRDTLYLKPRARWESFTRQLLTLRPQMSKDTAVLFLGAPIEGWDLHFLVWLYYGDRNIRVFKTPKEVKDFLDASRSLSDRHAYRFANGELVELSIEHLSAALPLSQPAQ